MSEISRNQPSVLRNWLAKGLNWEYYSENLCAFDGGVSNFGHGWVRVMMWASWDQILWEAECQIEHEQELGNGSDM